MNTSIQDLIKDLNRTQTALLNQEKELKELRMFKAKALGYKNQTELYQRSFLDAQKKIKELQDTIKCLSGGEDLTRLRKYVETFEKHA